MITRSATDTNLTDSEFQQVGSVSEKKLDKKRMKKEKKEKKKRLKALKRMKDYKPVERSGK